MHDRGLEGRESAGGRGPISTPTCCPGRAATSPRRRSPSAPRAPRRQRGHALRSQLRAAPGPPRGRSPATQRCVRDGRARARPPPRARRSPARGSAAAAAGEPARRGRPAPRPAPGPRPRAASPPRSDEAFPAARARGRAGCRRAPCTALRGPGTPLPYAPPPPRAALPAAAILQRADWSRGYRGDAGAAQKRGGSAHAQDRPAGGTGLGAWASFTLPLRIK